jgi:hypothetical protein
MRFIVGLVFGVLLTISGVYVYDARTAATAEGQPMVNWDVVSRNWNVVTDRARVELEHLGERARDEWNRRIG